MRALALGISAFALVIALILFATAEFAGAAAAQAAPPVAEAQAFTLVPTDLWDNVERVLLYWYERAQLFEKRAEKCGAV